MDDFNLMKIYGSTFEAGKQVLAKIESIVDCEEFVCIVFAFKGGGKGWCFYKKWVPISVTIGKELSVLMVNPERGEVLPLFDEAQGFGIKYDVVKAKIELVNDKVIVVSIDDNDEDVYAVMQSPTDGNIYGCGKGYEVQARIYRNIFHLKELGERGIEDESVVLSVFI
ncbi:MAG: hypothetical protein LBL47_04680 [Lactobacillus sp.]|jgi:hypothetical protein|nr:hypothetical protein [Lactobacillus sp.]